MGGNSKRSRYVSLRSQFFEDKGVEFAFSGPGQGLSQYDSPLVVAEGTQTDSSSLVLSFFLPGPAGFFPSPLEGSTVPAFLKGLVPGHGAVVPGLRL